MLSVLELPWILLLTALVFVAALLGSASGCASRTVLVPEGSPIRIGPDTRAKVYAMDEGAWRLSGNCVEIPEGWYCVPPSFVEESER